MLDVRIVARPGGRAGKLRRLRGTASREVPRRLRASPSAAEKTDRTRKTEIGPAVAFDHFPKRRPCLLLQSQTIRRPNIKVAMQLLRALRGSQMEQCGPVTYIIQKSPRTKPFRVHCLSILFWKSACE